MTDPKAPGGEREKAQLHPSDDLGWLVDRMADPDGRRDLCPKACARAHAALLRERRMMDVAAERDRAFIAEVDDLRDALRKLLLSRDASWTGGHDWEDAVGNAFAALGIGP